MRIILSALIIFMLSLPAMAGPVEDISLLQKGNLKSVRAPFKQKKQTELLPRPVKSKGTFYFKEGAGVRWVYDYQMVAIYDGSSLYLHYIELDDAEQIDGIAGFSGPLSFNVAELKKDYDIKAKVDSASGDIALKLTPSKRMPFVFMRMLFHKGQAFPYEVSVHEKSGDVTRINFIEPEFNIDLKDDLFKFTPPKGVTVRHRKLN